MSFGELVRDALSTLWRQKLRSALTIGGVVVAIAALVGLLSFAAGMTKNVRDEIEKFSLLQTMTVTADDADSTAVLDSTALAWMQTLPGVVQAFPQSPFQLQVIFGDTIVNSEAQAIPPNSRGSLLFRLMQAGDVFADDDTTSVLVTSQLLDKLDIEDADSLVGTPLVLTSEKGHPDSGYAAVRQTLMGEMPSVIGRTLFDANRADVDSMTAAMFGKVVEAFFDGYRTRVDTVRDTLTIAGVVEVGEGWSERLRPVILPEVAARRLDPGGFSRDPMAMAQSLQAGEMFSPASFLGGNEIDKVTLELAADANHDALRDSLSARGYHTSDFLEFYSEFRKVVLIFTAGMTALGGIALFIAALGIVNTMVMSILERRREIGVLKALGAEDRDIRVLFLVESGTIGLLGSLLGLFFGWLGSELVGLIMQQWMISQGAGSIDLFHVGLDTTLIAIAFGLVVSTVAGLYPASRAARLDPVVALREE